MSLVCFSGAGDEHRPDKRLDGEPADEIHSGLAARRGGSGIDLTGAVGAAQLPIYKMMAFDSPFANMGGFTMPNGFERLVYGRDERTRGGSASEETNAAVAAACGWDAETSEDGALEQLLNLNRGWRFPPSTNSFSARYSRSQFAR